MKIIGQKLTTSEMLSIRGGATCWCGPVGAPTYGPFTLEGANPVAITSQAYQICTSQGLGGEAHCNDFEQN